MTVQTWLPVPSFSETATILSDHHLYKARTDTYKILEASLGIEKRWLNHPAVVMWKGCEFQLVAYGLSVCAEWKVRHGSDSLEDRITHLLLDAMGAGVMSPQENSGTPWWLGVDGFHMSHRSNLVREDPKYYGKYWPKLTPELPLVWPQYKEPVRQTA